MKMPSFVKDVLKSTGIGFAVGVVLALVLPAAFSLMGMPDTAGNMANPLWLGTFSGLFSGVSTAGHLGFKALAGEPFKSALDEVERPQTKLVVRIINPEQEHHALGMHVHGHHVDALTKARDAAAHHSPDIHL
jgi:hypothetical protein